MAGFWTPSQISLHSNHVEDQQLTIIEPAWTSLGTRVPTNSAHLVVQRDQAPTVCIVKGFGKELKRAEGAASLPRKATENVEKEKQNKLDLLSPDDATTRYYYYSSSLSNCCVRALSLYQTERCATAPDLTSDAKPHRTS